MLQRYSNIYNSQRSVQLPFYDYFLEKYRKNGMNILDVGGIPTDNVFYNYKNKHTNRLTYKVCDFRGGDYKGDFVQIDFKQKFDIIIFLSSLQHFPQCGQGDNIYRNQEDIRGFQKALSILNDNGLIFFTAPFGKPIWQPYHQNYNMNLTFKLSKGSQILQQYTYKLNDNMWQLTNPYDMQQVLYIEKAFGCGLFIFKK